jgi:hypothetical protein
LSSAANNQVTLVDSEWAIAGTAVNQHGFNCAAHTQNYISGPSALGLIDPHLLQLHQIH